MNEFFKDFALGLVLFSTIVIAYMSFKELVFAMRDMDNAILESHE